MPDKQTVTITLPDDPAAPALVVFDGPLGDEALRLSKIPGSGWTLVADDPAAPGPYYLVDRRLVVPKPLRKGRPDARKRMIEYNEKRKGKDPDPEPDPQPAPKPAGLLSSGDVEVKTVPRTEEDGPVWSEREPEEQTPAEESPENPWGNFIF